MKEKPISLVLYFCCLVAMVAAMDCSKMEETTPLVLKCFTDQQLQLYESEFMVAQGLNSEVWLENLIIKHSSEICLKKEAYQRAVNCVVDVFKQCTIESKHMFDTKTELTSQLVAHFCDDKQKVQYDCVQKQLPQILKCEKDEIQEPCQMFHEHFDCHKSGLTVCGCHTVRAFEMILVGMYRPLDCPKDMQRDVIITCETQADTKQSMGGAGELSDHVSVSLVVTLVFTAFELFAY
ncbi:hypothetical protein BsWGS_24735 [Bradybaena similaris]